MGDVLLAKPSAASGGAAAVVAWADFELVPASSSAPVCTPDPSSYCYDVGRTWEDNLMRGLPSRCGELPPAARTWAPRDAWIDFLGHKLASPLGVAAGPLLSSAWVALAADRGYDCLVYKTIRSHHHAGHGLPNILQLDVGNEQLQVRGPEAGRPLTARAASVSAAAPNGQPQQQLPLAITNSFGMPSLGPDDVVADLPHAAAAMRPGQMLVVSVTGTPGYQGRTFTDDLQSAAAVALAGGATALEVNLSCPNVGASHVALYQDAPAVEEVVRHLSQSVGGRAPLLLKLGAYPDPDCLRRVLAGAAAAGAAGVAGINGLNRRVEAAGGGGAPALGAARPTSGVCGDPIRGAGLEFVADARRVIASGGLQLGLVGVGGVTRAEHVMQYLRAGANVVHAATGFMYRPDLGLDFQRTWAAAGFACAREDGRGGRA